MYTYIYIYVYTYSYTMPLRTVRYTRSVPVGTERSLPTLHFRIPKSTLGDCSAVSNCRTVSQNCWIWNPSAPTHRQVVYRCSSAWHSIVPRNTAENVSTAGSLEHHAPCRRMRCNAAMRHSLAWPMNWIAISTHGVQGWKAASEQ